MDIILHPGNKSYKPDFKMSDEPTMFKTGEVNIYDILENNQNFYVVCRINPSINYAMVDKLEKNPTYIKNVEYESELICPYCGSIKLDMWEYSENNGTIECGSCGMDYEFERQVEVTYSSVGIKCPEVRHI